MTEQETTGELREEVTSKQTEPALDGSSRGERRGCPVVSIGVSAGGLDALEGLFRHMPSDSGAAFVIVEHLDLRHLTLRMDLLKRITDMPVQQATDGAPIEPNQVTLIPPSTVLTMADGRLQITARTPASRAPIDALFRSLAEAQGSNCIGVILSGAGSDGVLGLKAIKEHGGIAMAQALESARFNDMPRNAIALGLVDQALPADKLAPRLVEYVRGLRGVGPSAADALSDTAGIEAELQTICALLQRRTGNDFNRYKRTTLIRRIRRRMQVLQSSSAVEYVDQLARKPGEAEQLFKDLLIGVTQFFRDPEAFEALARQAVASLLQNRSAAVPMRVWAPACASGEEAYSIAILLREAAGPEGPTAKIFATDIDDLALEAARSGQYPIGIAEFVTPERLETFSSRGTRRATRSGRRSGTCASSPRTTSSAILPFRAST